MAQVINKSPIITRKTTFYGEGKLFFINLMDASGEIQCKAYNNHCEQFYDKIQVYILFKFV